LRGLVPVLSINLDTFALRLTPPGPWPQQFVDQVILPPCPHHCGRRIEVVWSDTALGAEIPAYVPGSWSCPSGCDVTSSEGRHVARWRSRNTARRRARQR